MGRDTRKFSSDDLKALDAALSGYHSRHVLRRLRAVKLVLGGASVWDVAISFRRQPETVTRWVNQFRKQGCEALLDRPRPPRWSMEKPALKVEIRAAMKGDLSTWELARLKAVAAALDGMPVAEIAIRLRRPKNTIWLWLARLKSGGVKALLCNTEIRKRRQQQRAQLQDISLLAAACDELRLFARGEENCVARRRLVALAEMGAGTDRKEVAARASVREETLQKWVKDFQQRGMKGLRISAAS